MIKAFSKKLLLWLFPIFTTVGINYLIDSANLFNQEIIEEASQFVSQGKSVAVLTNYDERFFQKRVIDLNAIPNVVVIGSSRVMQIGNDNWGSSFYNNGVSSATIMDYYAIIQHYINKGSNPDFVTAEKSLALLADKYQIPSIGTYYKNDLNYASFYDARHPTREFMNDLVKLD